MKPSQENDLQRLIRQIRNDGAIAHHLGITREEVARERAKLGSRTKSYHTVHSGEVEREAMPFAHDRLITSDIAEATERLRVATIRAIQRYANIHSIDIDTAARRLLSEGVA